MELKLTGPTDALLQFARLAQQDGLGVEVAGTYEELLAQDFGSRIGGEESVGLHIPADVAALVAHSAKSSEFRRLQTLYFQRCIEVGTLVVRSASKASKDVWVYGNPSKRALAGLRPGSGRLQVEVPFGEASKLYGTLVSKVSGNDKACSVYLTSHEAVDAAVSLTIRAKETQTLSE